MTGADQVDLLRRLCSCTCGFPGRCWIRFWQSSSPEVRDVLVAVHLGLTQLDLGARPLSTLKSRSNTRCLILPDFVIVSSCQKQNRKDEYLGFSRLPGSPETTMIVVEQVLGTSLALRLFVLSDRRLAWQYHDASASYRTA